MNERLAPGVMTERLAARRALEEASLRAWPAIETAHFGGWVLRSSEGFTGRANSVQALDGPGQAFEDRVSWCERWYGDRGRPCLFRLSPLSEPGLDAFLDARGYGRFDRTLVLHRETAGLRRDGSRLELSAASLHEWLRVYAGFTGLPAAPAPMGRIIERIDAPALLGLLRSGGVGRVVACGLAVADRAHVGLFDLVVAPTERRKGIGTELVGALLDWGAARGARTAYLQVTEDNEPALRLYRRLGFEDSYDYWYRVEGEPRPGRQAEPPVKGSGA